MAAAEDSLLQERSRDAVAYSWALLAAIAAAGLLIVAFTAAWVRGARRAGRALATANESIAHANERLERTVEERTRALRESTERLTLILDSAVDYAFITMDVGGRITSWSPGAQSIFGWTAEEAVGQPGSLIFTDEDKRDGAPEREVGQALTHGRAPDERWHRRKDGSRLFASGELMRMGGAEHGVTLLKIARDRTQARRQEEELREFTAALEQRVAERTRELSDSNRALVAEMKSRESAETQVRQLQKMEAVGQLTGGIAHDFNNMLAIVIGSLNLVQRRLAKGDTDILKYVDGAIEGATRAATLTSRLLAFSRRQPLAPEPVDANRLVTGMSEILRRTIGEEIRLETVLAGGLWRSHADPSQLENAILNLAVNARDAMPDGGKLTIESANCHLDDAYVSQNEGAVPGQYVMLAVSDTGTGMTPEVRDKAFEPFFTTKDVGRGTGLGLSQVYGFVRQSGGHVKIYSEPGQGTTVKLYIPRFIGIEEKLAVAPVKQATPAGNPREIILVVEDEDRVRQFAVEALRELGYTTLHADGAAPALRVLDGHPDVTMLLTDIVMPDVNGRRLAEEALKRRPNLKVVYMTGFTRNAVVHNGVLDPGVNFLQKPFTLDQLASKVRGVLGAPPV
ncbi:response regulator [Salinarimonas soli]|uniref:histidine kinase n=3 Tax=Salinarimonas soli TaxID=1638099 RepID=A0A5B2VB51_9HYPH|nr:response regulator [Salinarimonas soli]